MARDVTGQVLDRALTAHPEILASLEELHAAAIAAVDPAILNICRDRIAALLGASTTTNTPAELTAAQHACLALTEQFVVDVAGMTDELVAGVAAELGGDGLVNFVNGLLVVEQRLRMQLTFDRLLPADLGSS